jgi:hypothetical protein
MANIQDTRTTMKMRVVDISLGFELWWGEIFRTRPDLHSSPPSLVYNEYRYLVPGGKAAGTWR